MKKKCIVITILLLNSLLFSFWVPGSSSPDDNIKKFYLEQFQVLAKSILLLHTAVENNETEKNLQDKFLVARLNYKKIEFILEYYYDLDVTMINGPGIDFIEEEDPLAFHDPQGFQMIESFLFPAYDTANKKLLLDYTHRLAQLTTGLSNNAPSSFQPDEFIMDAAMEELYRILALGLSGFDSPAGHLSILEAQSSLGSIKLVIEFYKDEIIASGIKDYDQALARVQKAIQYLGKNPDFNKFDRMYFIIQFLNPITSWLGNAKTKLGYTDNPARYGLIRKTSNLFTRESLQRNRYLYDDTITKARIELGEKLFYEPGSQRMESAPAPVAISPPGGLLMGCKKQMSWTSTLRYCAIRPLSLERSLTEKPVL